MLNLCLVCDVSQTFDHDGFVCFPCQQEHFIDQYGTYFQPELVVDGYGTKRWRVNGKLHRLDGPAIEWSSGHKEWWVNGKLHRLDGPAVEYSGGSKQWFVGGKCHRLDGPAIEWPNGDKEWYVDGKYLSEEEWKEYIRKIK